MWCYTSFSLNFLEFLIYKANHFYPDIEFQSCISIQFKACSTVFHYHTLCIPQALEYFHQEIQVKLDLIWLGLGFKFRTRFNSI